MQKKFRVWDKLEKRFIYSDSENKEHYVLTLSGEFHNLQNGSGGKECVIQQFSGIYDKDGRGIYEGDIVTVLINDDPEDFQWCLYEIGFIKGCFYIILRGKEIELLNEYNKGCEIVGNIFENIDLLK